MPVHIRTRRQTSFHNNDAHAAVASLATAAQDATVDTEGGGSITHGIQVDETNTGPRISTTASGVPAGSYVMNQGFLDTYNGGSNVFNAKSFSGVSWHDSADGLAVTFNDCIIGGGSYGIGIETSTNGRITFNYCHLYGTLDPINNLGSYGWSAGYGPFGYHIDCFGCDIEGYGALAVPTGDNVFEECYIHDCAPYQSEANGGPPPDGTHHDGFLIQFFESEDIYVRRCHIKPYRGTYPTVNDQGISAAWAQYNDSTHPGPVQMIDCYIDGAGVYASYWGGIAGKGAPSTYSTNLTVTGNIFGREAYRYCGLGWCAVQGAFDLASNTWTDNRWGALGPENEVGDEAEDSLIDEPVSG